MEHPKQITYFGRKYTQPSPTRYFQSGRLFLHREVWRRERGPIPRGYHVHHIDHDPGNNRIENLALVSPAEHAREHWSEKRAREHTARLDAVRHLSAQWHRSKAGREWHREHARRVAATLRPKAATCDRCGKRYESKNPGRFCSNACKSAWRRVAGMDDEDRKCSICGRTFRASRYSRNRACSRACGGRAQSRTKRGLQPDGR